MLSTAGDQVPEMLFVLVAGRLKASPLQMSAIGLKEGILPDPTFTVIDSEVAHCPRSGVKVYVVVVVLSTAGDHEPVIPFVDVDGKTTASPGQISAIGRKSVITASETVTSISS